MKLGITSIQRNRAPWLVEWVAFHALVGFNKFYIYLHKCSDESEKVLKELQVQFDIEITIVSDTWENPQLTCYKDSYDRHGNDVDWMAFIDGDEFLFPTSAQTMDSALSTFTNKHISVLGVYWACFGSNGHIIEPNGLIIENYSRRAPDDYENNRHIKSIVKGGQGDVIVPIDPHLFATTLGTYDENMRRIEKGWTDYAPTYSHFRINHYVTQSREYFDTFKRTFQTPDGSAKRNESYWEEHNRNEELDTSMQRFIGPLRELLK